MLSFGTRSLTLFPCLMSLTEYFKVFHKGPFIYYVIHLYMFPFDIFSKTDILSFFSDTNILLSYLIYSILIFNLRDWPTCGSSPSTSSTPSSSPTGSLQRGSRWFSTSVHSHQWFERWLNGDQNIILWNAIDIYSLLKIPKGAGSFKDCFLQSRACPEPF